MRVTTRTDLKSIMLSHRRRTKQSTYRMIPFTQTFRNYESNPQPRK